MSQFIIYMSCLLVMICQVQCATKTKACSGERVELRKEVIMALNKMASVGRKEIRNFYNKGLKCRGYIERENPFPTDLLAGSLRHFVGTKFLPQNYKLFRPFLDAFVDIVNGSTAVPTKEPEIQLWNVKTYVVQVVVCVYIKLPSKPKPLPVKYNPETHKQDIKKCLINAGVKPTPRRVKIVQYSEIFEELYDAVLGMASIASHIKYLKLK